MVNKALLIGASAIGLLGVGGIGLYALSKTTPTRTAILPTVTTGQSGAEQVSCPQGYTYNPSSKKCDSNAAAEIPKPPTEPAGGCRAGTKWNSEIGVCEAFEEIVENPSGCDWKPLGKFVYKLGNGGTRYKYANKGYSATASFSDEDKKYAWMPFTYSSKGPFVSDSVARLKNNTIIGRINWMLRNCNSLGDKSVQICIVKGAALSIKKDGKTHMANNLGLAYRPISCMESGETRIMYTDNRGYSIQNVTYVNSTAVLSEYKPAKKDSGGTVFPWVFYGVEKHPAVSVTIIALATALLLTAMRK